jgi:hypothetical protein
VGRNRYRAARAADVDCPSRDFEGDDPLDFVVSLNLKRRHLDESQRAIVAAKLATLSVGRPLNASIEAISQKGAAAMLTVSRSAVQRASIVRDHGTPELVAAVESGKVAVSAAAVASYARQADDDALERHAMRIRARAIRRAGEILKQIEPAPNHHGNSSGDGTGPTSRKDAASSAGMSSHQAKTAIRVANVPASDFDKAVEGAGRPATPSNSTALPSNKLRLIKVKSFHPFSMFYKQIGIIG